MATVQSFLVTNLVKEYVMRKVLIVLFVAAMFSAGFMFFGYVDGLDAIAGWGDPIDGIAGWGDPIDRIAGWGDPIDGIAGWGDPIDLA